jgi:Baseplate J-like protein
VATIYLENDDEITSVIGRIRAVSESDAILVVPPGSRIATSRINFKLLAREAAERRMNLVAVSDEPQVRALAISAGLPAYDSIPTAQKALTTFREQDRRLAERIDPIMPRDHGGETMVLPPPKPPASRYASAPAVPVDTAVLPAQQAATRRKRQRRRIPIAPLIVLGLVLLLVVGVGYGAYVFLPTATITVKPVTTQVTTPAFTVTADPHVAVVDPGSGVIPAQTISVPVHVDGTFTATGVDAHDVRAGGSIRFTSENTVNPVSIPKNTVVSTSDGVDFVTLDDVVVPTASFASGPTQADVDIRAVKGGTAGNVDANTITVVPAAITQQVVTASNPDPTTGGKHVEVQVVSQDDYNAALTSLSGQLDSALQQSLADTTNVPRGLVAFPATAQMSAGQPDQPAASVVGTDEPSFTLALDATADVTAVNESQIDQVAAARIQAELAPGQELVDAVTAGHDGGTVLDNTVVYNVTASAQGYTSPDPQALIVAVKGKSVADARAALASYGIADISIWPEFVDHLPDQAARISVTIVPPSAAPLQASPSPAPTSPTATPVTPAAT